MRTIRRSVLRQGCRTQAVRHTHTHTHTQRHKGTKAQRHKGTKAQRHKGAKARRHMRAASFFPTRQEGVDRFYVGIRVCDASTPRPRPVTRHSSSLVDRAEHLARAARQWIPPSIPRELLASGSHPVSRHSSSPVDRAEHLTRAARKWIPPSIPPEWLAAEYPAIACSPVDPAEYPARAARQWIPPSTPPEWLASGCRRVSRHSLLASGSRRVSRHSSFPVYPSQYPTISALRCIPPSIRPELLANGSRRILQRLAWIPPSIL